MYTTFQATSRVNSRPKLDLTDLTPQHQDLNYFLPKFPDAIPELSSCLRNTDYIRRSRFFRLENTGNAGEQPADYYLDRAFLIRKIQAGFGLANHTDTSKQSCDIVSLVPKSSNTVYV